MFKRFTFVFLVVIFLPVIFYAGWVINSLNTSEKILSQVYNQQLNAALITLNQYAWNQIDEWATAVDQLSGTNIDSLQEFLSRNPSLRLILITDSLQSSIRMVGASAVHNVFPAGLKDSLVLRRPVLSDLNRFMVLNNYRKFEPFLLPSGNESEKMVVLVFSSRKLPRRVLGFALDAGRFTREVLRSRLNEVSGEQFIIGVMAGPRSRLVYATREVETSEFKVTKPLWILPEYRIGIRLMGKSADEIIENRLVLNMILIGVLSIVLIIGVVYIYRLVRREVDLVRLKTDFVSNVSHELRTPLTLIRMYAETLDLHPNLKEEKRQNYYRIILNESDRLGRLINNILNFSRIESVKDPYRKSVIEVTQVVSAVVSLYEVQFTAAGFDWAYEPGETAPVLADKEAVSEAVHNLIDNAVKYSGETKWIRISTRTVGRETGISVEDHGVGIDQKHHGMIFDKFSRVATGLVHNTKGSGLGLALVHHIMKHHDGRIELESSPGKGSRFTLWFPVKHTEPVQDPAIRT